MHLVAALSWYDEKPEWLSELVHSLADAGINHLVALDGRYALFPGATPTSPLEQAEAIADACLARQLPFDLHETEQPVSETQKRTWLFDLAHLHAKPGQDWICIADADEVWTHTAGLRRHLAYAEQDVAEAYLYEQEPGQLTHPVRRFYRAQPSGIHVTGAHYRYKTGDGQWLWEPNRADQADSLQMPQIQIQHRVRERTEARNAKREQYYETRFLTRIEEPGMWETTQP